MNKKRLVFTVTNDLTYDQRMIRICSSLHAVGYAVTLVGRETALSAAPNNLPFEQVRLFCLFQRGPLFYAEYNLKLFIRLLFMKADLICAIDLDTILPCLFVSKIRGIKRVYDAHELFCEMKEVVSRKFIYRMWKGIEQYTVPQFSACYTVNEEIARILSSDYGIIPRIIRNIPVLEKQDPVAKQAFIIYQGAVNHGRAFESLIPAFMEIPVPFFIYGDGNFLPAAKSLVRELRLEEKVYFKGKLTPGQLRQVTPAAILGITLFENRGLSNYFSLANRFFDYMHAGIPQVCVNYPLYRAINDEVQVAVLVDDLSPHHLASVINRTISDTALLQTMALNCDTARRKYNWQQEEKKLIQFYKEIFA